MFIFNFEEWDKIKDVQIKGSKKNLAVFWPIATLTVMKKIIAKINSVFLLWPTLYKYKINKLPNPSVCVRSLKLTGKIIHN